MKNYFLLIILFFYTLVSIAATPPNLSKSEKRKIKKELKEMEADLGMQFSDDFIDYFNPNLMDAFFTYIQEDDYESLYENTDEALKAIQTKEETEQYFRAIKRIYGEIINYQQDRFTFNEQGPSKDKTITAIYDVEFEKINGNIALLVNAKSPNEILLMGAEVGTQANAQVEELDLISKSTFDYLQNQDYDALYNATSAEFKYNYSKEKFEDFINIIKEVDFSTYKLVDNQIGIIDNSVTIFMLFNINDGEGYFHLFLTEIEDNFLIKSFDYHPGR